MLVSYAMRPGDLQWPTLFTCLFLHANLLHLAGNMLFLWIFGDNVEDKLGHVAYAAFYLVCGLGADFLHIVTAPDSMIPTLGASGAISGVVGAYAVFFPRHRVKMLFVWFVIQVIRVPAVGWIGFWFLQQVFFSMRGLGGVAYMAHIGGFVAGAAIAGLVRFGASAFRTSARVPSEIREPSRSSNPRRPFITIENDSGVEFLDTHADDTYAVLRLTDELHHVGTIAAVTAEATGGNPRDVARRLAATRGMIARGLPRVTAERIQRSLHARNLASAIVVDNPVNRPPAPALATSGSWDGRALRLSHGGTYAAIPWETPFLFIGAGVGRTTFVDLFLNRRAAFRIADGAPLTEVDPLRRRERPADLADFARAVLKFRSGAALNEGIRVLAGHGSWGWLHFADASDYDDYVFWTYNLILSRVPVHMIK